MVRHILVLSKLAIPPSSVASVVSVTSGVCPHRPPRLIFNPDSASSSESNLRASQ